MHKIAKSSISLTIMLGMLGGSTVLANPLTTTTYMDNNSKEYVELLNSKSINEKSNIPSNTNEYKTTTQMFNVSMQNINILSGTGWKDIDNSRYYCVSSIMKASAVATTAELKFVVDLAKIDGKVYYFNNYGQLQKGWMSFSDGNRYYFNPNNGGAAYTGWYQDGNAGIMYFNSDGAMQKGITQIEGKTYFFETHGNGKNAYKTTGWYSASNGDRYYFNPTENGAASTGTVMINGTQYTFDNNGVLQK